jgi:uncharacterized protein with ParB-like and HNH nuclease domain
LIDYTSTPRNIATLVREITNGNISFDIAVQRGEVWDINRKTLFIDSLISNYPIEPVMFAYDSSAKINYVIQGKQRLSTINNFVNNKIKLSKKMEPITIDDKIYELAGLNFTSLPEEVQEIIKSRSIDCWRLEDLSDEEIAEVFYRINNGKPLTNIEIFRVQTKGFDVFKKLAKHPVIVNAITNKGKSKFLDEQTVLYT